MSVVYCPRTQSRFDHGRYPLAGMLQTGVRVALGTDSRSSNPDLSLWRELQHVREHHPEVDSLEVLRLGTLNGAEALGVDRNWGSLTPGKRAALLQLPLGSTAATGDQLEIDFSQTPQCVVA